MTRVVVQQMRQRLEAALHERVVRPPLFPAPAAPAPFIGSPSSRGGAAEAKGRGGGDGGMHIPMGGGGRREGEVDDDDDDDDDEEEDGPERLSAQQRELLNRVLSTPVAAGAPRAGVTPPEVRTALLRVCLCACARAGAWCLVTMPRARGREQRPLFNLDVDIGGGQTRRIIVHRSDSVSRLAADFVLENRLPESAHRRLATLLSQNIRLHKEKMQAAGARQHR